MNKTKNTIIAILILIAVGLAYFFVTNPVDDAPVAEEPASTASDVAVEPASTASEVASEPASK